LVVVTTSTADRKPEKNFPRSAQDVIQAIMQGSLLVVRFIVPHAKPVVTRRDQRIKGEVIKFVPGQLLAHEPVVRLVIVERADDVIAVTPDVRFFIIAFITVSLREAHEIEPMPPPSFAVLRAS